MGRLLIASGLVLVAVGVLVVLGEKVGWLGRLPGDFVVRRGNFSFYFPLATCLLISVILSLIFWLFRK